MKPVLAHVEHRRRFRGQCRVELPFSDLGTPLDRQLPLCVERRLQLLVRLLRLVVPPVGDTVKPHFGVRGRHRQFQRGCGRRGNTSRHITPAAATRQLHPDRQIQPVSSPSRNIEHDNRLHAHFHLLPTGSVRQVAQLWRRHAQPRRLAVKIRASQHAARNALRILQKEYGKLPSSPR